MHYCVKMSVLATSIRYYTFLNIVPQKYDARILFFFLYPCIKIGNVKGTRAKNCALQATRLGKNKGYRTQTQLNFCQKKRGISRSHSLALKQANHYQLFFLFPQFLIFFGVKY